MRMISTNHGLSLFSGAYREMFLEGCKLHNTFPEKFGVLQVIDIRKLLGVKRLCFLDDVFLGGIT